jgi:16S rRNA (guanine527-N7)-methyltransferase
VKHAALAGLDVSRETEQKLDAYLGLILAWNRTINLVSRGDESHLVERHLMDSLSLIPYLPPTFDHAVDLGSGGGFPAIPLALVTGHHFDVVEADNRKAAFLREAVRITGAPVTVHPHRIEGIVLPLAPLVTARALAPLTTLLGWAAPLLAKGGFCVFPKGRSVAEELTQAMLEWHMQIEQWPSPLRPGAVILRLSEISRV